LQELPTSLPYEQLKNNISTPPAGYWR